MLRTYHMPGTLFLKQSSRNALPFYFTAQKRMMHKEVESLIQGHRAK